VKYSPFTTKVLQASIVALVLSSTVNAQQIDLTYGSFTDGGNSLVSLFTNEAGVGFSGSNTGYMAFGYFADGFDVLNEADALTVDNYATFITNFNPISDTNFNSLDADSAGFNTRSHNDLDEAGVGKVGYLLTLAGIDDWANRTSATEIGLFRKDGSYNDNDPPAGGMGTIPAGKSLPDPNTSYAVNFIDYDEPILGGELLDQDIWGDFDTFNYKGNLYSTQALVPEPSTYALLISAASFGFVYYRRKATAKKSHKEEESAETNA
jgi:hypothetical protein